MPFQPFERDADRIEYRRHLPHWNQPDCTYFVTFRLADSLPASTLREWRMEREAWLKSHGIQVPDQVTKLPAEARREYQRHFTSRLHAFLDSGQGACILREPRFSQVVAEALQFFDKQRYAMGNFVVMPNHVHLLVTPFGEWTLEDLLHSWKRHTALTINRLRERRGPIWMDESFDHVVRSYDQLCYFREYILENPRKAKLREGEFVLGCGSDGQE